MMPGLRSFPLVGAGGMIGAMLRLAMVAAVSLGAGQPTVLGTFAVNVLGSFLIGVCNGYALHRGGLNDAMKLFLVPGILGGFTTFSAFAWDSVTLFERAGYLSSLVYIVASVTLSILAVICGMGMIRWINI